MTIPAATGRLSAFANEPVTDFSIPANRAAAEAALARVRTELGRDYELWIAGTSHKTGDLLSSINPSKTSEVVGKHHKATLH
jgi:1-pyrroline-5-carboxylate dehydrogenase